MPMLKKWTWKKILFSCAGIICVSIVGSVLLLVFTRPIQSVLTSWRHVRLIRQDKQTRFELSLCDSTALKRYNGTDYIADDFTRSVDHVLQQLGSFQNFSQLYPARTADWKPYYQYNANNYLQESADVYAFAKNLPATAVVLRLFINRNTSMFLEDYSAQYNVYLDVCNNKILHIQYQ